MISEMHQLFSYDPDSGVIRRRQGRLKGRALRSIRHDGYIRATVGGKEFVAHRIAYVLMNSRWPAAYLDHINGDRQDNRWSNIREATPLQNTINRRVIRDGMKGVTRRGDRFIAQCKISGKTRYLGIFDTEMDAHLTYLARMREVFGDFVRAA